jgi:hypothetical protein
LDGGEKNIVSTSQFGSIEQNIVITNLDKLVLNKVSNPDEVIRDPGGFSIRKEETNPGSKMSIILNVLSNEMSFDKYFLQREAWRFLEKCGRPPSCESPLKFRAPSCILIGYLKTIANGAHSFFHYIQLLAKAL